MAAGFRGHGFGKHGHYLHRGSMAACFEISGPPRCSFKCGLQGGANMPVKRAVQTALKRFGFFNSSLSMSEFYLAAAAKVRHDLAVWKWTLREHFYASCGELFGA